LCRTGIKTGQRITVSVNEINAGKNILNENILITP
jgi:hypothetical protein